MKTLFNIITFCVFFRELICDNSHIQSPNDKEKPIWSKDQCDAYCFDIAKPLLNHMINLNEKIDTFDNMTEKIQNLEKDLKTSEMQQKTNNDLLNEKEGQLNDKDALIYKKDELIKDLRTQMRKDSIILEGKEQQLTEFMHQEGKLPFNEIQRIQIGDQEPFKVSCTSPSSGWTVIQRRLNGSVDFHRNWEDYEKGFGDIRGEFFIGLDKLHLMTQAKSYEMYIQMRDFNGTIKYARYSNFTVGSKEKNYKLISVGSYTGTADDSLSDHVGYMFTTRDRDNDIFDMNCAENGKGGWWFNNCGRSFLNGKYYENGKASDNNGIAWGTWKKWDFSISLTFTEMMIRPTL